MPGVVVTTATRSGPSAPQQKSSGQFFVAGLCERGATDKPILLRGTADMDRHLGVRQSYGYVFDAVKTFFDEGGTQCYVARVVGGAATSGNLTLDDREDPTPDQTLRVEAANPGAWSTQLKVEIRNGALADTYRVTVYLNDVVVQDVNNLATPTAGVNAFAQSAFVRLVDLGSATSAPDNIPLAITPTALSAGSDDRAAVVDADYVTALARFNADFGDGAVAIPGLSTTAIWTGITDHCELYSRIGLLAAARNASVASLQGRSEEVLSEYSGIFAPWVRISDGAGGYIAIPPEGYVAACRARAINQVGPWRAPAGEIAVAQTITEPDQLFSATEATALDDARVSAIRYMAGTTRLYGWRSLSSDQTNYKLLKDRDVLNYLVYACGNALEFYLFSSIDPKGQLLSNINAALVGVVDPLALAGGLYAKYDATGKEIDPGYKVTTDSSVNTAETLAENEINALVAVRISPTGALINLTIVKVALLSGL